MLGVIAIILFILGYVFISFENIFRISKSAIALTLGTLLWFFAIFSIHTKGVLVNTFQQTGNEVFGVVMFLLASMALVEVMAAHHLFDTLQQKLTMLHLGVRGQFIFLFIFSFFVSAVLDNMIVGLVMIQVAKKFFKGKNLFLMAAGVIIGANAGGSWSPIGDVTTVLIWLAGKYDALTIIKQGFLPAAVFLCISGIFLVFQIEHEQTIDNETRGHVQLSGKDKAIIALCLISFLLPIFANSFGLPPYLGLLFGLGLVWIFRQISIRSEGKDFYSMEEILKRLDIASLKFYTGILLCSNALAALGILGYFSHIIFGATQQFFHVVWGSVIVGLLFAMVDNIPLTAVSIKLITLHAQSFWVLLALTIGNGGSALLLGSAAGIAVMSNVQNLTMTKYFKIAFFPVLLGYAAMVGVWLIQYQLGVR